MKKFIEEFKAFALKGNVVDMSVGIIIGAAFGGIVNSLVKDVLMPPLGLLTGSVDFSEKVWVMKQATETAEAVTLNYGLFINSLINFLIIALAIFVIIKQMNKLREKEEAAPSEPKKPSDEVVLLTEIRDALKR